MAKLVTSDGVQINLFLDLNSHNTGEGTLLYGPKSQAEMDFIVKGFRNFKTNTEYNDKNRLEFHSDVEIEVSISTLMSANPTSSSQYTVPGHSNTKLYFVGDDLVLSKTGSKIHRIDLFTSASSNTVTSVNGNSPDASGNVTVSTGSSFDGDYNSLSNKPSLFDGDYNSLSNKPSLFDGNYNSLSNKPTIPTDINQLDDDSQLLSSGGGGGFTNQKVFTASTTWTVPAGVDKVKISVTGSGDRGGSDGSNGLRAGGAGGSAIAIFSVTSGETLTMTLGAPKSNSFVEISGRSGNIAGFSAQSASGGASHCTITTGLIGDALLVQGGSFQGQTDVRMGASSIYGNGEAYGGGSGHSSWSSWTNSYTTSPGVAVVVLEY